MVDPKVSGEDRYKLFKTACDSHVNYMRDASEGFGCDRHLLGLKLLAQDAGLTHPIWNDKAYKESSWWRLSTSQLPSKYALTGYGPVVPDGYGIYYNIRDSVRT
jgi:carnitine O-acetyltransferase